jgi:hypothetical protein
VTLLLRKGLKGQYKGVTPRQLRRWISLIRDQMVLV